MTLAQVRGSIILIMKMVMPSIALNGLLENICYFSICHLLQYFTMAERRTLPFSAARIVIYKLTCLFTGMESL